MTKDCIVHSFITLIVTYKSGIWEKQKVDLPLSEYELSLRRENEYLDYFIVA